MRLGIDLDGVVADFNNGWIQVYNAEFGTDLTADQVKTWDAALDLTHFEDLPRFWRWARRGDGPSIFRWFQPYPGAVEAIETLAGDHDIVILTVKPDWAVHDTLAWIAEHRIPTREIHLRDDKWRVPCDVYLDDSPFQLPDLVRHRPGAEVCRYVRPWNEPVPGARDVTGWDGFLAVVRSLGTSHRSHPEAREPSPGFSVPPTGLSD